MLQPMKIKLKQNQVFQAQFCSILIGLSTLNGYLFIALHSLFLKIDKFILKKLTHIT